MTEAVINQLPEKLREYICTLKRTSLDMTNQKPMCESNLKVINFDRIPNEYARGKGWSDNTYGMENHSRCEFCKKKYKLYFSL